MPVEHQIAVRSPAPEHRLRRQPCAGSNGTPLGWAVDERPAVIRPLRSGSTRHRCADHARLPTIRHSVRTRGRRACERRWPRFRPASCSELETYRCSRPSPFWRLRCHWADRSGESWPRPSCRSWDCRGRVCHRGSGAGSCRRVGRDPGRESFAGGRPPRGTDTGHPDRRAFLTGLPRHLAP